MNSSTLALAVSLTLAAPAAASPQGVSANAPRTILGAKPAKTFVSDAHMPGKLEIKLVHGMGARLVSGRLVAPDARMEAVENVLQSFNAKRSRLWQQDDASLVAYRAEAEARSQKPLHDLTQFFLVEVPADRSVADACDALNALPGVELAYPVGTGGDPVWTAPVTAMASAAGSGTPNFEGMQGYRRAAPLGIDADYGNTFSGGWGQKVIIADCETGWTDDHEDISHAAEDMYVGLAPTFYPWNHGTAVVGELVGERNGEGVLGMVYGAGIRLSSHQGSAANFATAIQAGVTAVGVGDAVVIEIQCSGGVPGPYPCEYVPSVYAVIETATAAGINVFAAAGNGSNNLDSAAYGGLFDRSVRDSGAVMVGASNGSTLNTASFSNFGSRVDVHGWGFNVTTAGYGDLQGGPETVEYTDSFSGTSSATPIVTGAGMILASIYESAYDTTLDPLELRAALVATGTPQGSGGIIGPRPNLRAAIPYLNLPRVDLEGPLTIGSDYSVVQRGEPGDVQALIFSPVIASDPHFHSIYGDLFLDRPVTRVLTSLLDVNGEATHTATIPDDPALIGATLGYFQGWQRFQNASGVGTFTNYVPLTVQ
jgi:hypothetical protein